MPFTVPLLPELTIPEVRVAVPAVDDLVARLAVATIGETTNQYSPGVEGGAERAARLRAYLTARWDAPVVLVGEAAGYQGCRLSGVAFSSVFQFGVGDTKEPSATIVHRVLRRLGVEEQVLLWNVVPTHPHRPGEHRSNRTPTPVEVEQGAAFLPVVAAGRKVIAVGRIAAKMTGAEYVRHPAHGGASAFEEGVAAFFARLRADSGVC